MRLFYKFFLIYLMVLIFNVNNIVVQAADLDAGEVVFSANCASCHAGGQNVLMPDKTLQLDALEKYEKNTVELIQTQVTNGKNQMPAFGDRLSDDDIINVANFVLNQAKTDSW